MDSDNLRLIVFKNCIDLGRKVDMHIQEKRGISKSFIVPIKEVRFNNGEGKISIDDTIRDKDVYILSDTQNHHITYKMYNYINHMSPDDHFLDIKRTISAINCQANSIHVIEPLLYASRQHQRNGRESLDCAMALQDLENMGVKTLITFDAHDPKAQMAVKRMGFENFYPSNTMLNYFVSNENIGDYENLMVISPDYGAMKRARIYADMLKVKEIGFFDKRRDYSKIVNGKNPIIEHKYIGGDVSSKDIIIVDDMIASGGSILDVAKQLKEKGANKIFLMATFALFTNGYEIFDEYYDKGIINRIYTTNLTYVDDTIKKRKWFSEVDCSLYIAEIIDRLSNHQSISDIINKKEIVKIRKRTLWEDDNDVF